MGKLLGKWHFLGKTLGKWHFFQKKIIKKYPGGALYRGDWGAPLSYTGLDCIVLVHSCRVSDVLEIRDLCHARGHPNWWRGKDGNYEKGVCWCILIPAWFFLKSTLNRIWQIVSDHQLCYFILHVKVKFFPRSNKFFDRVYTGMENKKKMFHF